MNLLSVGVVREKGKGRMVVGGLAKSSLRVRVIYISTMRSLDECGWDLAEWLECQAVIAKVATVLGSIPASYDTAESEEWQKNPAKKMLDQIYVPLASCHSLLPQLYICKSLIRMNLLCVAVVGQLYLTLASCQSLLPQLYICKSLTRNESAVCGCGGSTLPDTGQLSVSISSWDPRWSQHNHRCFQLRNERISDTLKWSDLVWLYRPEVLYQNGWSRTLQPETGV